MRPDTPPSLATEPLADALLALEEAYDFMDQVAHLLVVAGPKARPSRAV